jgi:hypothetical protein
MKVSTATTGPVYPALILVRPLGRHVRSELRSDSSSRADNGCRSGKPLVDWLISHTDGDNSAPIATQCRDDGAGLAGGGAEVEDT